MLFNSIPYLVFLPIVVTIYYLLDQRARQWFLLAASLFFYGFWGFERSAGWGQRLDDWVITIGLLLTTTIVDFNIAKAIARESDERRRRTILCISIVANLSMLAVFKYANFLRASAIDWFGIALWPHLNAVLPPGISFYTFMSMAYVIDVYRRELPARDRLIDFAVFVAYFPHLVAGPILRAKGLLPQMMAKQALDWNNVRRGLAVILWGMFVKVYLADPMAHVVNETYGAGLDGASSRASGAGLALATYAFTVQIYFDFAGYSAIAIGSALLLGIRLPENFRTPYLSLSLAEFWRRWHISLSSWLRDYLYISLGGSRLGKLRTYANLMVTMLLGGIWHGAGWHWLIWGGIQGFIMSAERMLGIGEAHPSSRWARMLRWFVTFHIVCISWIFFRAHDVGHALSVLQRILTWAPGEFYFGIKPLLFVGLMLLIERFEVQERWVGWIIGRPTLLRWVTYTSIVVLVLTFMGASNPEFLYFQF